MHIFRIPGLALNRTHNLLKSIRWPGCLAVFNLALHFVSGPRVLKATWIGYDSGRRGFEIILEKYVPYWNYWYGIARVSIPASRGYLYFYALHLGSGQRYRFLIRTYCINGTTSEWVYSPELVIP